MWALLGQLLLKLNQIGTAYPNLIFFFTFFTYCWLGDTLITHYLLEKQSRDITSRGVFVLTFSCSLSLLSMYLYQILRFPISQYYWYTVTWLLVILCELIIPLCLISRFPGTCQIVGKNIPIVPLSVAVLYIWWFLSQLKDHDKFQLRTLIDIVVHYGVYIIALMSAYGAIWCPYLYYNLTNQKQLSKIVQAKRKTQKQINFIIQQTKKHKYQIMILNNRISNLQKQVQIQKSQRSGVFVFLQGLGIGSGKQKQRELQILLQRRQRQKIELETLQKVHEDSFLHYRDILQQQRRQLVSQTLFGKFFRKMSFILAAYSITRIVLTVINTIRGRKMSTDPISRLLGFIQGFATVGESIQQASQYISFIFMGYIMITSVRSFTMNFKTFLDYILRRKRLNMLDTATQIYFFSLVYGVYFLAAIILQQCGLPRAYVSGFEMITGLSTNYHLLPYFVLFDYLFLGMCVFSILLVLFTEYYRHGKIKNIIHDRNIIA